MSRLLQASSPSTVTAAPPPPLKKAKTCRPSVTGVGVACEFCSSFRPGSCRKTSRSHSTLPTLASTQMTWQEAPPSVVLLMKTRSPQTIGDDQPTPGTSTDQATSAFVQLVGSPTSAQTPWPD